MTDMAKALGKTDAATAMDFVSALTQLQAACGVDKLKMSDYGVVYDELPAYVDNAFDTMGGLFRVDPCTLTKKDVLEIYRASYR